MILSFLSIAVMCLFTFLILLLWIFSFRLLVDLAKGLSLFIFYFLKEPNLHLIDSLYFVSVSLISALSLIISSHLLFWDIIFFLFL